MEQGDSPSSAAGRESGDRYCRQVLFAPLGPEGQRRLLSSRVLLVGCGALGSTLANLIVRAGVGRLRIVDRDVVELDNLHRLVLFDEDDVREGLPKAEAARRKLARINSGVTVEAVVDDVNHMNIVELAEGAHLILDGTDNFETRFVLNDCAMKLSKPWVFAGVMGTQAQMMTIVPGRTPCLRCLMDAPPATESGPRAVLGPAVAVTSSFEATEAVKLLSGHSDRINPCLLVFDVWDNTIRQIDVSPARADCPCCVHRRFEFLEPNPR